MKIETEYKRIAHELEEGMTDRQLNQECLLAAFVYGINPVTVKEAVFYYHAHTFDCEIVPVERAA